MAVELRVKFPVDDAVLSALHHRAFSPDRPDTDVATRRGQAGWSAIA
jgi:hypothetical protein